MLRKDTIYVTKNHWEPKIPSTKTIQEQVARNETKLAGSIRLARGKVIGAEGKIVKNHWETKIPSTKTVQVQVARNETKLAESIRLPRGKVIGIEGKIVRPDNKKIR